MVKNYEPPPAGDMAGEMETDMLLYEEFKKITGIGITEKHNDKMYGLCSLSTSPTCNPDCKKRISDPGMVCSHCYREKMTRRFKNLRQMLERNSEALTSRIIPDDELPYLYSPTGFFRFEAFGDLISWVQVANYFRMAARSPHMKCCLFTKNPWIIAEAIEKGYEKPENLTIIGSSYYLNKPMVTGFKKYDFVDYIFTVYTKDYIKANDVNITCGGRSCKDCGKCYTKQHNEYEIREELK